jgi:mevalonate kinase
VPASLAPLARLAVRHGGAAKPTGAGGGDQILAVFADPADADAFEAAVRDTGMTIVAAHVDPHGARLDATPET